MPISSEILRGSNFWLIESAGPGSPVVAASDGRKGSKPGRAALNPAASKGTSSANWFLWEPARPPARDTKTGGPRRRIVVLVSKQPVG